MSIIVYKNGVFMGFIKDFLFLNLNQYNNIAINFPIGAVILFSAVCASLAAFYLNFANARSYDICKQLFRFGAFSEFSARTLKELHLDSSRYIRFILSRSGGVTRIVKRVGEKTLTYEEYLESVKLKQKPEKINFDEARFYISPEAKEKANAMLSSSTPSIYKPIALTVFLALLLVLAVLFLPDLLSAINSAVN